MSRALKKGSLKRASNRPDSSENAGPAPSDPVQDRKPIGRLENRPRDLVAVVEQAGSLHEQLEPDHPVRQQPNGKEGKVHGQVQFEFEKQRFSRERSGIQHRRNEDRRRSDGLCHSRLQDRR